MLFLIGRNIEQQILRTNTKILFEVLNYCFSFMFEIHYSSPTLQFLRPVQNRLRMEFGH